MKTPHFLFDFFEVDSSQGWAVEDEPGAVVGYSRHWRISKGEELEVFARR